MTRRLPIAALKNWKDERDTVDSDRSQGSRVYQSIDLGVLSVST